MRKPDWRAACRFLPVVLPLFFSFALKAQVVTPDSLPEVKTLGLGDLAMQKNKETEVIYGADRIPENTDELAVRTYVFSAQEIGRNGWSTINDILRTLPEFKISEASSALVGESFLMRGLVGNIYTKFLINGIPITPSAAPGMPLGAQLPVRQAERIEIVIGPASTIYGNDAMAGVINIVLADIKHPVEATASAAVGNAGTEEFHLMIGGKAGKTKNAVAYQILGSSKQIQDRNLKLPDDLIRVDSNAVRNNPYYSGKDGIPTIGDIRHESRILGVGLGFRDFKVEVLHLYRSDQSALGSHPEEISYNDPNRNTADYINNIQLQYDKTIGNLWLHSNVSQLDYWVDKTSSYVGVHHPISNGVNYLYARSRDMLFEQLVSYNAGHVRFLGGASLLMKKGVSYEHYLGSYYDKSGVVSSPSGTPVLDASDDTMSLIAPFVSYLTYNQKDYALFGQATYKRDKFNITAGLRGDLPDSQSLFLSPKLSIFYHPMHRVSFRGMYARAFRNAGSYYTDNNYRYKAAPNEPMPNLKRERVRLAPEVMNNFELGATIKASMHLRIDLHWFMHQLENSIFITQEFPDSVQITPQNAHSINMFMGYFNATSLSTLQGYQAFLQYGQGPFLAEFGGTYFIGKELIEGIDTVDGYRNVPTFMAQLNLHYDIPKVCRISVYGKMTGDFINYIAQVNRKIMVQQTTGYSQVDLLLTRSFSRRIDAFVHVNNLADGITKGIYVNAVSRKRLEYIPQPGRTYLVGLNFRLN